jgi:hypothetical protein
MNERVENRLMGLRKALRASLTCPAAFGRVRGEK